MGEGKGQPLRLTAGMSEGRSEWVIHYVLFYSCSARLWAE